jgi:hypothetical protein
VAFIPLATYDWSGSDPRGQVNARLRERYVDVYANDRADPLGISPDPQRRSFGYNTTLWTDGVSYEVSVVRSESRF